MSIRKAIFICFMLLFVGTLFCICEAEAVTITVNQGESIQEAINILPNEGGVIKLVAGIHEVNDTMYPPGSFETFGGDAAHYSIIINKSNVTITGTCDSIVRHHNKSLTCFYIPDLELTEGPDVFIKNVTLKGFTTTSTYTKADWARNSMISALHVKNFTVDDMHDTSWAGNYVGVGSSQSHQRYSENVSYKNNLLEHSGVSICFTYNVYIINNTILGHRGNYGLYTARNLKYIHVIGNRIINAGYNSGMTVDGGSYWEVRDNVFKGSQECIRAEQGVTHAVIENNTLTEATRQAISIIPQPPMRDVIIRNNFIYNNADGIRTSQYQGAWGVSDVTITNNILCNNSGDGIKMTSEYVALNISNNIITNNSGYGINFLDGNITHSYNNVWGNTPGSYNNTTAGTGDICTEPLFADAATNDFHLKSTGGRWNGSAWVYDNVTSPCIDAGDPASDYSNEPEPNGGRLNIGAYGNTKEASKSPPPVIHTFYPQSRVRDVPGATRTFNITLNQIVNVSWHINGTEVQTNVSATEAAYTNTSAANGTWNVSVAVSNPNGTAMQTWIWKVGTNQHPIASFSYSPVNPVINQTIAFNATNSTDPDGTIINYEWNFGDGNITNTTEPIINHSYASAGTYTVNLAVTDEEGAINATSRAITVSEGLVFDTGTGTYPSIAGTHNGTITTNVTIKISKLYTYPCEGTGGHPEHVIIRNESRVIIAEAYWGGYQVDGHNISFDVPFTLVKNKTYNYTIRTGSYPQIIHNQTYRNEYGTITCTNFTDVNGRVYYDGIPAIRME